MNKTLLGLALVEFCLTSASAATISENGRRVMLICHNDMVPIKGNRSVRPLRGLCR